MFKFGDTRHPPLKNFSPRRYFQFRCGQKPRVILINGSMRSRTRVSKTSSHLFGLAHDGEWAQFFVLESALFGVEDLLAWDCGQMKLAIGHVDLGRDHRKQRRSARRLLFYQGWMDGWMDEWMNGWMDGWKWQSYQRHFLIAMYSTLYFVSSNLQE